MGDRKKLIIFPAELLDFAENYAEKHGKTFSALVRNALATYVGFNGSIEVAPAHGAGGDLARYKTAETHARVCEKMREAKAIKHIREEAKKRIATNRDGEEKRSNAA